MERKHMTRRSGRLRREEAPFGATLHTRSLTALPPSLSALEFIGSRGYFEFRGAAFSLSPFFLSFSNSLRA